MCVEGKKGKNFPERGKSIRSKKNTFQWGILFYYLKKYICKIGPKLTNKLIEI